MKLLDELIKNYDKSKNLDDYDDYKENKEHFDKINNKYDLIEFLNKYNFVIAKSRPNFYKFDETNITDEFYEKFKNFIDDSVDLKKRWKNFEFTNLGVEGFGPTFKSEILCYSNPLKYPLMTNQIYNSVDALFGKRYKETFTFKNYVEATNLLQNMLDKLKKKYPDANMLDVNEILSSNNDNIINTEFLEKEIKQYIKNIDTRIVSEKHKWKALKEFKNNWNLDIENDKLPQMLKESFETYGTIINMPPNYSQLDNLIEISKEASLDVKEAFKKLYNEKLALTNRVNQFIQKFKELEKNYLTDIRGEQNSHSISVYLTSMYPDKYYIYKKNIHNEVMKKLGRNINGTTFGRTYENYVEVCNIVNDYINNSPLRKDLEKVYNYLDDYVMDNNHMLTMDILYSIGNKYRKNNDEENTLEEVDNMSKNVFEYYNLIINGIPGSGKSFHIDKKLNEANCSDENYERVTFYPEYTYSDFIGTYKIGSDEKIKPVPGPFTSLLKKALLNEDEMYYLVIEEMSRGNAEAIFGDIFQLLDRDEDGNSKYKITNDFIYECLNIDEESVNLESKKIYIPSNLILVATINTSDQNVFNLDTAFGRRWNYIRFTDDKSYEEDTDNYFKEGKYIKGFDNILWNSINDNTGFRNKINDKILSNENIWNKEDKILGLFYISKNNLIEQNDPSSDTKSKLNFINKVIRYLWFDVYSNNHEDLIDALKEILNIDLNKKEIISFDILAKKLQNSKQGELNEK